MGRTNIKKLVRDAVKAHFETQAADELSGVQVVSTFSGLALTTKHIRITTPTAIPADPAGNINLGRWMVTCRIIVVTQTDDVTDDEHDNLSGLVEAYALQGNKTLAEALATESLVVDNVRLGDASEGQQDGLRASSQEIEIECYATGS